jgi:ribosomal protein S18 acetylase RimI-like enzyme
MIETVEGAGEVARLGIGAFISESFDHLEADHFLVPDEARRTEVMGRYFGMLAESAAGGAGEVLRIVDDGATAACAVWFDRTREGEPWDEYEQLLAEVAGVHLPRFQQLDEAFDALHPHEPHWHLAFLAVRPDRWGHGLGTTLLDHTHARLDASGTAAYLEATNEDNARLYRKHGYAEMTPAIIEVGPVKFRRMWR